jgi:hypothetical protein
MAKDDDVQLVESIGGIDGMPPTSNVSNMHMHGFVVVNSTIVVLNLVDIVVTSNYVIVASNFVEVEMQQLATIQV